MRRIKNAWIVMVLVVVAMSTVGCVDQYKTQIAELQQQNNDLSAKNTDLQAQLARSNSGSTDLLNQLDAKDMQIKSLKSDRDIALKQMADLQAKSAQSAAGWKQTTVGDEISVGTDVLFSPGKAALTAEGKKKLSSIAADIKGKYSGRPVRVYGYTDSDPIVKSKKLWEDNLDLSANRAMAVTRYLISSGIDKSMLETVAMGDTHPSDSNKTAEGKKKNRRVEIMVVKK